VDADLKERDRMAVWLLPTLGYIVIIGATGVTTKLALRTISWQQLVLCVPIVYAAFAIAFAVFGGARLPSGAGGGWAVATAVLAASGLILFFFALSRGDASQVVPATSAYPVVTLVAAAVFLSEPVTLTRIVGTILVVAGVVLISR
jgi:bacterial/archaeal transporter family protein